MASNYERQIFKQLEEVMKQCDNLSQEIKDLKKKHAIEIFELNEKHKKEVQALNQKIDTLEKENTELKEKVDILEGRAVQKNSSNSNIPPSKDEYKTQNHREKSSRKQGGQKGRIGKTLTLEEIMRCYCPEDFGLKDPTKKFCHERGCEKCWNREYKEEE